MATFAQYAMAAAEEALDDAGWRPTSDADLEATVRNPQHLRCSTDKVQGVYIGSGIGSLDDAYNTAIAYKEGVGSHLGHFTSLG